MLPTDDYLSGVKHSWCPGCGNAVIQQAMKQALKELKIPHENIVFVSGIGCGSKFPRYMGTYGFETLHGRILPNASGIKLANKNLTVIGIGGDGDGYGIGLNHFINTMRRNMDITYIVQDNEIYALTKGQASPTSPKGMVTKTTPSGQIEIPINPIAMALTAGATFIARTFSMDPVHMKQTIMAAVRHHGISHVQIIQTCPSMHKDFDFEHLKTKVYKIPDDHDKTSFEAAWKLSQETEKIPIGIFYEQPISAERPSYVDELFQMKEKALVDHDISNVDISGILEEYK